jgi:glycosyltransferase involved in cell wall biosynthesis
LPIVVSGGSLSAEAVSDAATTAGLPAERVIALPALGDDDRAVAIAHATAFVYPTLVSGFGTPMLEAFRFGIPVIHSDAAALVEVAGDAGFSVPSTNRDAYPGLLAEAIENVLDDDSLRRRLSVLGADREKLFTWRTPAEGIWQLQADL